MIPEIEIQEGDVFYIGVYGEKWSWYNLKIVWSGNLVISINQFFPLFFADNTDISELTLVIPDGENEGLTHILIQADL